MLTIDIGMVLYVMYGHKYVKQTSKIKHGFISKIMMGYN